MDWIFNDPIHIYFEFKYLGQGRLDKISVST